MGKPCADPWRPTQKRASACEDAQFEECARSTARALVHETLTRVQAEGGRCVLVIHGRGRHSETEPILKEALLGWLAEPPAGPLVMAFTSALGGDGGVGATYVLLRRERERL